MSSTVRRLAAPDLLLDSRSDLGEGPMWHPGRGELSWVEIYEHRLNWLRLDGTAGASVDVGRRVGAAVPTASPALMLATDAGFVRLEADGSSTLVAPVEEDVDDWFLNDGKCDARGRFWAGTIGVGADGLAARGQATLFCLEPDGSVRRALEGLSLSNGMDWSPDGGTFYFIDSLDGGIDAFAFDLDAGTIRDRRRAVTLDTPPQVAFADGMCVDRDGCIWTAVWGAGEVRRYTPDGRLDTVIPVPATQPTSCAFAGAELDVLVITSARRGLSDEALRDEPHAGSVFCCRPGTAGFPPHAYAGG